MKTFVITFTNGGTALYVCSGWVAVFKLLVEAVLARVILFEEIKSIHVQ